MAATSGGDKAYFQNVDSGSTFYVQFNPKEFKMDESASWKDSDEQEKQEPLLTYEKGNPTKVSMELIFDTTDNGSSVADTYIKELRAFFSTTVSGSGKMRQSVLRTACFRGAA